MKHLNKKQLIYLHSMAIKRTSGLDEIGNKRIGILAMMVFLDVNGIKLKFTDEEIVDLGLGIASGKYDDKYMAEWIIASSK